MLRFLVSHAVLSAALLFSPPLAAASPTNGWGIEQTDVAPDPAIHYGKLANGMRFAIMRNSTPPGAATIELQFAFGSIAESDSERGLAHFIEHMAFNGTTHVPEGEMEARLQREGLAIGADSNALTGFDTTSYIFNVPKADAERVDSAMFLLREISSEMKLDSGAIDRERAVILSEGRTRGGFTPSETGDLLQFQLPETPYWRRLPIGTEAVVKTASAEMLRSLYRRYYRPEYATLVIVGDVDPAAVERKIAATFGTWSNASPAGAPLPRGRIDGSRGEALHNLINATRPTIVDYTVLRPWQKLADTMAERRRRTLEALGTSIFNRRLQQLTTRPGTSLLGGTMLLQQRQGTAELTSVKVVAKDGAWKDALLASEQEIRRALQYGFTPTEVQTAVAQARGAARITAEQGKSRTNQAIVRSILAAGSNDQFVTTPAFRAKSFETFVKDLTPVDVQAAFRGLWTGGRPLIHLTTKAIVPRTELQQVLADSRKLPVAAPAETTVAAFAYDHFGDPGKIVSDKRVADLGVRFIRFKNNVSLTLKKTAFEPGKVRFMIRLGDGTLDLPKDKPGLNLMMSITSAAAGVGKHSQDELQQILAGKSIRLGSSVADDAFVAAGTTSPTDLPVQMKVSAAYLLDPGYRPEAQSKWSAALPMLQRQLDSEPEAVAVSRLPALWANGDPRFGMPDADALRQRNFAEARATLTPLLADAPIEVTIVGDLNETAAIAAVAQTFGALRARAKGSAALADARKVQFRVDPAPILLFHDGRPDKALVQIAWPTTDDSDFKTDLGLTLLKDVLNLMLMNSVREQLGDTYAVNVRNFLSSTYPGFGYLSASAIVAPDKVEEVSAAIERAADQLRSEPVSADLLARARNPELARADRAVQDNGFWLGALVRAQTEPDRLDRIRRLKPELAKVTASDIQELARKYLQAAASRKALIVKRKPVPAPAS